jgi:hypothetical protein
MGGGNIAAGRRQRGGDNVVAERMGVWASAGWQRRQCDIGSTAVGRGWTASTMRSATRRRHLGYWAAAPRLLGGGSSRLDVGRDWAFGLCDRTQL